MRYTLKEYRLIIVIHQGMYELLDREGKDWQSCIPSFYRWAFKWHHRFTISHFGATFLKEELLFTEMRHVSCIAHDKSGLRALHFNQDERPLNYQIAASAEKDIDLACEKIIAQGVDLVDLNVDCPARNVIKSGSGSALMADLPRLKIVLDRLQSVCRFLLPLKYGHDLSKRMLLMLQNLLKIVARLQSPFILGFVMKCLRVDLIMP